MHHYPIVPHGSGMSHPYMPVTPWNHGYFPTLSHYPPFFMPNGHHNPLLHPEFQKSFASSSNDMVQNQVIHNWNNQILPPPPWNGVPPMNHWNLMQLNDPGSSNPSNQPPVDMNTNQINHHGNILPHEKVTCFVGLVC